MLSPRRDAGNLLELADAGEMESLVSLQSYEPKLQAYLLEQRYPAIIEVGGARPWLECEITFFRLC